MTELAVTVVVPAWDEAEGIAQAVGAVVAGMPAAVRDWEIVVVDDGSTDGTGDVVRALGAADGRIRCVAHPENRGKGSAVRTGIAQARLPWVLLLDADQQVRIDELRAAIRGDGVPDAVVGYRVGRREPPVRKLVTFLYGAIVRALLGVRVRDVNCPFKLFRREDLRAVTLRSDGFAIDAELLMRLAARGVASREVPVEWHGRVHGASSIGPRAVPGVARELLRLLRERLAPAPTPRG